MHGSELGLPRTLLLGDWIDTWSIRKVLRMSYTRHVINAAIRETTSRPPVSSILVIFKGDCFASSYVARANSNRITDMSSCFDQQVIGARGRQRTTWLRRIDAGVQSANIEVHKPGGRLAIARSIATYHRYGTPLKKSKSV